MNFKYTDDTINGEDLYAHLTDLLEKRDDDSISSDELEEMQEIDCIYYDTDDIDDKTFINARYWIKYCRELCEDVYTTELAALPNFLQFSIDWEVVSRELRHDYDIVTMQGVDWYVEI